MSISKEQEKLVETIQKLLNLKEEDRERIIRIVQKHHPRKILVALENAYRVDKRGRKKAVLTLEEFEKMLERTRW